MPGSKPTTTSLKNAIRGIAIARSFCPSLQMAGKVLVRLEHRHLVLAEDPPELIVGQDFASVLWVLQVVQANVLPHLAHHLSPWQRVRADHRGQLLRRRGGCRRQERARPRRSRRTGPAARRLSL